MAKTLYIEVFNSYFVPLVKLKVQVASSSVEILHWYFLCKRKCYRDYSPISRPASEDSFWIANLIPINYRPFKHFLNASNQILLFESLCNDFSKLNSEKYLNFGWQNVIFGPKSQKNLELVNTTNPPLILIITVIFQRSNWKPGVQIYPFLWKKHKIYRVKSGKILSSRWSCNLAFPSKYPYNDLELELRNSKNSL